MRVFPREVRLDFFSPLRKDIRLLSLASFHPDPLFCGSCGAFFFFHVVKRGPFVGVDAFPSAPALSCFCCLSHIRRRLFTQGRDAGFLSDYLFFFGTRRRFFFCWESSSQGRFFFRISSFSTHPSPLPFPFFFLAHWVHFFFSGTHKVLVPAPFFSWNATYDPCFRTTRQGTYEKGWLFFTFSWSPPFPHQNFGPFFSPGNNS